jgi:hypothetical protein
MQRILPERTPFEGVPYEGCAATIPVGSDSYPGTVVRVEGEIDVVRPFYEDGKRKDRQLRIPRKVWIRECSYRGVEGHYNDHTEDQRYVYYEDDELPEREGREYSWRPKWGKYVRVGTSSRSTAAQSPGFGIRRAYRDPCF